MRCAARNIAYRTCASRSGAETPCAAGPNTQSGSARKVNAVSAIHSSATMPSMMGRARTDRIGFASAVWTVTWAAYSMTSRIASSFAMSSASGAPAPEPMVTRDRGRVREGRGVGAGAGRCGGAAGAEGPALGGGFRGLGDSGCPNCCPGASGRPGVSDGLRGGGGGGKDGLEGGFCANRYSWSRYTSERRAGTDVML
jgi:hypothetical protein